MPDVADHPVLFDGSPTEPETLAEVIFQAIGAGSVCWDDMSGTGVFESDRAKALGDEVVAWIEAHYVPSERVERVLDEVYAQKTTGARRHRAIAIQHRQQGGIRLADRHMRSALNYNHEAAGVAAVRKALETQQGGGRDV